MNPPSNQLPPNVPGGSSLPPSDLPPSNVPPPYTPPPKSGGGLFSTRNVVIGLVVLVFACCVCGGIGTFAFFAAANRTIEQVATSIPSVLLTEVPRLGTVVPGQAAVLLAGNDFMNKLKDGDWARAYTLCTADLQSELGSAAELGKRITSGRAQPVSWNFASNDVGTKEAQLDGTATFSGNRTGTVRLVLDRAGNNWKISGFNLTPR